MTDAKHTMLAEFRLHGVDDARLRRIGEVLG